MQPTSGREKKGREHYLLSIIYQDLSRARTEASPKSQGGRTSAA